MKKAKNKFILLKMMAMMTPPCQEIDLLITESFYRKLKFRERWSIKIHNLGCIVCKRYRDQMLFLQNLLTGYLIELDERDDLISPLPENTKARIVDALNKKMV